MRHGAQIESDGHPEGAETLHDKDLAAINDRNSPERIKPRPFEDVAIAADKVTLTLPPASWTVTRFESAT